MSKQQLKRVRRALGLPVNREPLPKFAWPGGYPLVYLFADGGVCCPSCAGKSLHLIDADMFGAGCRGPRVGGWAMSGVEVNWETPTPCDHCGTIIPAAYAAGDESEGGEGHE